jgi:hypothetical protein
MKPSTANTILAIYRESKTKRLVYNYKDYNNELTAKLLSQSRRCQWKSFMGLGTTLARNTSDRTRCKSKKKLLG